MCFISDLVINKYPTAHINLTEWYLKAKVDDQQAFDSDKIYLLKRNESVRVTFIEAGNLVRL